MELLVIRCNIKMLHVMTDNLSQEFVFQTSNELFEEKFYLYLENYTLDIKNKNVSYFCLEVYYVNFFMKEAFL